MSDMSVNDMDPVADEAFPEISEMDSDPSLPVPPEQDQLPEQADQPEPEEIEVPDESDPTADEPMDLPPEVTDDMDSMRDGPSVPDHVAPADSTGVRP